jgi:hypothetical protein
MSDASSLRFVPVADDDLPEQVLKLVLGGHVLVAAGCGERAGGDDFYRAAGNRSIRGIAARRR